MEDASVDAKGRRKTMNTKFLLILQLTSFLLATLFLHIALIYLLLFSRFHIKYHHEEIKY